MIIAITPLTFTTLPPLELVTETMQASGVRMADVAYLQGLCTFNHSETVGQMNVLERVITLRGMYESLNLGTQVFDMECQHS